MLAEVPTVTANPVFDWDRDIFSLLSSALFRISSGDCRITDRGNGMARKRTKAAPKYVVNISLNAWDIAKAGAAARHFRLEKRAR